MAISNVGQSYWNFREDGDGNREYTIKFKLVSTSSSTGPSQIRNALRNTIPVGTPWAYGGLDLYATCTPYMVLERIGPGKNEPGVWWEAELKFSTRPLNRCYDSEVGNPLLEPANISGSFITESKEITKGYPAPSGQGQSGDYVASVPLKSASHEMLRGPQVEFEYGFPTVVIEQNVNAYWLELGLMAQYMSEGAINSTAHSGWGLGSGTRVVRLADATWQQKFWSTTNVYTCSIPYFTRRLVFEIKMTGWDKEAINEGTKARGYWQPNPAPGTWITSGSVSDPSSFNRYRDKTGEISNVLLTANGTPLSDIDAIDTITVRGYPERDLFALHIPTNLNRPDITGIS